jgi:hypothetical protein
MLVFHASLSSTFSRRSRPGFLPLHRRDALFPRARRRGANVRTIKDVGGSVFRTLEQLCSATSGGTVTLQIPAEIKSKVDSTYREAMDQLNAFAFWREGAAARYRPKKGLWLPQRRAIAFAHGYLSARRHRGPDEAALIKMPTGTGKTGVASRNTPLRAPGRWPAARRCFGRRWS